MTPMVAAKSGISTRLLSRAVVRTPVPTPTRAVAMGLPIATALVGVGTGVLTTALLSNLVEMPDFAATIGVMIGLGVGIDYALFIVTRYQEHLEAGESVPESVAAALDTAGRAVLF